MRKFLLLFIVVLLTGCELPTNGIIKRSSFSENTIAFKDSIIELTDGYAKMAPDEFLTRLDSLKDKPMFKKVTLRELEKVKSKNVEFEIFVEDENIENYVLVYARDYVQFDEFSAQRYVARLNDRLKDESNVQEVRYKRIHGRYFYTPKSKIVKLKYLKALKKERKFQTEYIVSSQSGGMGLLVSNLDDVDFEDRIKKSTVK
ncbi:hypothetical protein [Aquimarina sp. 2201CG5-10]|uniref:hypothetical protein n=1 Tax=Aquimarina callyspongiae TaxID=3098150 RepID=UPI002AB3A6B6|nr:hypothetical protein [Aquimarina sp. 2201CG5-10]MDY8137137.1 hypothetical protein [Aquimarina sp. 2201CG5-10]